MDIAFLWVLSVGSLCVCYLDALCVCLAVVRWFDLLFYISSRVADCFGGGAVWLFGVFAMLMVVLRWL